MASVVRANMAFLFVHLWRFRLETIVFEFIVFIDPISCHEHMRGFLDVEGTLSAELVRRELYILVSLNLSFVPHPKYKDPIRLSSKREELALLVLIRKA